MPAAHRLAIEACHRFFNNEVPGLPHVNHPRLALVNIKRMEESTHLLIIEVLKIPGLAHPRPPFFSLPRLPCKVARADARAI